MSWDYNKIEEEMEERNHQLGLSFQRARKEAQIDEMIKNAGLYSIASSDGRAQLSFFPPISEDEKKDNKKFQENVSENKRDDEENGI